jgi:drug/metabolite transporter (DMT)-like permease
MTLTATRAAMVLFTLLRFMPIGRWVGARRFPLGCDDSMTASERPACYTFAVAIALALGSALVYGISDYLGGRSSRRFAPLSVTFFAELTLLVLFVPTVPFIEDGQPTAAAIGWGVVAGVMGSLGVFGLYAALSRGSMTVVAPVTGVVAAAVPVVAGFAMGERPGSLTVVGIVLAIVAVGLIGGVVGVTHQRVDAATVVLAVLVGGAFGLMFIAYARTGDDAGLWPLAWARLGGTPMLGVAYLAARRRNVLEPFSLAVLRPSVSVGVLVGLANTLYLLSTREGLLSVVAVLVSLYPASTIVLASLLDHERASRSQLGGMAVAAVAVSMITVGS